MLGFQEAEVAREAVDPLHFLLLYHHDGLLFKLGFEDQLFFGKDLAWVGIALVLLHHCRLARF